MATASEADEFKLKGNELFKQGKTDDAIEMYTKAIELDSNHIYFSNRSAALLKKGDAEKALEDATSCLQLNPDFEKGYSRKGAALQSLKRFDESIAVYEEGVSKFPDNDKLRDELENVKLAKEAASELAQVTRNSKASMMASVSKQKKAEESQSLSSFVQHTKSSLELQIFALQAQLNLVNSLAGMSDEQKMQALFRLVDADHDGKVDARELANAIRRRNANLSFAESVDRAITFVAAFDDDHDARLDFAEFKKFVNTFAESLNVSFHEISEFLILQNLFSETGNTPEEDLVGALTEEAIDEAVKEKEIVYDAMGDPRMTALFALFDKDGTGDISFREVAIGLWQLTDNMEESAKTAVSVLLMMTEEEQRTLDYEGFTVLILSIVGASGISFAEAADEMTLTMLQEKTVSEDEIMTLVVGEAVYAEAMAMIEEEEEFQEVVDALQMSRLQRLFDLFDSDGDGRISFEELLNGMRKFQGQMNIEESVERAALVMVGFDEDQNQSLDKFEFAKSLIAYAKTAEVSLDELVTFMCVVSVTEENSAEERAFFKAISPQATKEIMQVEAEMEALGIE